MTDKAQVRSVFNGASERSGPDRKAWLDGACHGNAELRARVERLLAAAEKADPFLASPTGAPGARAVVDAAAIAEGPGTSIGPYKLLQQIGQGGFGVVFMAEQQTPVVRRVALKIIKLGMDTRALIGRFEQERQALAMMDHPNIAKVLDAGATESGRPYFVMELVRGEAITDYCDRQNLDTHERLDLFMSVCHAVQHAHQKGIIHRDIKPSNVLVTVADGRPIPKVIDFGIAKATLGRLTEMTVFTEHRALIGTPEYMSPEQAEMTAVDIDTRSDVYSLGVLLYELLTGTTPFDGRELRSAAYGEMQRMIREVEPQKPSTRVSTLKGTLPAVAAHRRVEPARLGALIRGDLDWIVMRCLEKDRVRRYDTASGLALDVQRHLAGEPVLAAPPSALYKARKFVKRNKGPVTAVAFVALALILGVIGTSVGFLRAKHQEALAEAARAEGDAQRVTAEKARARVEAINQFVHSALVSSDPNQGGKQDMLVADAMKQALAQLDSGAFADDPETQAELRVTIANILHGNGRSADAETQLVQALDIYRRLHPGDSAEVALTMNELALAREAQGRMSEAEPLMVQSLEMRRRLFQGDNAAVAVSLNNLGYVRQSLQRDADAFELYTEALHMWQRLYPGDDPRVADGLGNVASTLMSLGRAREAEPLYVQALEMNQRLFHGDHPEVAAGFGNLSTVRAEQGHLAEAEKLRIKALEMSQRVFHGDHPDVALNLAALGRLRTSLGRIDEAEPLLTQALDMYRRLHSGDHASTAQTSSDLAHARAALQGPGEAEPLFAEALGMRQRLAGGDNPDMASAMNDLAMAWTSLGRTAEAEKLSVQALEMTRRLFKDDHAFVAGALASLGHIRLQLGRLAEAEPLFAESLAMQRRLHPGDHVDVASAMIKLAYVRMELGRKDDAQELDSQALEMGRRLHAGDDLDVFVSLNNVGWDQMQLGHPDRAEPLYREALAMRKRMIPGDDPQTAGTMTNLARCLADLGKVDEALPLAIEADEMANRILPAEHRTRKKCATYLADIRALHDAADRH